MGHLRAPQADSDLDDIWFYVASKSGSVEVADRFIDSITLDSEVLPWANIKLSTEFGMLTC